MREPELLKEIRVLKRCKKMDEWKTIEPSVWKPQREGQRIEGVLVSKIPQDEKTGLSARYYIETKAGMFFLWGTAVLEDRMQYVKFGDRVRITFGGKTKNKRHQDVNLFKVEVAQGQDPGPNGNQAPVDTMEEIEEIDEIR